MEIPQRLQLESGDACLEHRKSRFHGGSFVIGLFLGPLALLFVDLKVRTRICSAVLGWVTSWILILFAIACVSEWNAFQERRQEERRLALEIQERERLQEEKRRREELRQKAAKEEEERAKRAVLAEYNATVREVNKVKNSINFILNGNKWKGFGEREIATCLEVEKVPPEDTTIPHRIYQLDSTLADIRAALKHSHDELKEKEDLLSGLHLLHESFEKDKEQRELQEFAAEQIKEAGFDFDIGKRLFIHAFWVKSICPIVYDDVLIDLEKAYEQENWLRFLDIACKAMGNAEGVTSFPNQEKIIQILKGARKRGYTVQVKTQDASSGELLVVQVSNDKSGMPRLVSHDSQFTVSLMETNKYYVIEKGAFDSLSKKLAVAKQKGEEVQNALEALLAQNVSYDEERKRAEQDAWYRENARRHAAQQRRDAEMNRERAEREAEARRERAYRQREINERKAEERRLKRERFRTTGSL